MPDWKEMVTQLVTGHEIAAATSRDVIKAADTAGDKDKADMVTGRLKDHEKTVDVAFAVEVMTREIPSPLRGGRCALINQNFCV